MLKHCVWISMRVYVLFFLSMMYPLTYTRFFVQRQLALATGIMVRKKVQMFSKNLLSSIGRTMTQKLAPEHKEKMAAKATSFRALVVNCGFYDTRLYLCAYANEVRITQSQLHAHSCLSVLWTSNCHCLMLWTCLYVSYFSCILHLISVLNCESTDCTT